MVAKNKPTIEIKSLRQRLGLTQVEFGAAIGVDPITVSRWERVINPTKPSKLARRRIEELAAKK